MRVHLLQELKALPTYYSEHPRVSAHNTKPLARLRSHAEERSPAIADLLCTEQVISLSVAMITNTSWTV